MVWLSVIQDPRGEGGLKQPLPLTPRKVMDLQGGKVYLPERFTDFCP